MFERLWLLALFLTLVLKYRSYPHYLRCPVYGSNPECFWGLGFWPGLFLLGDTLLLTNKVLRILLFLHYSLSFFGLPMSWHSGLSLTTYTLDLTLTPSLHQLTCKSRATSLRMVYLRIMSTARGTPPQPWPWTPRWAASARATRRRWLLAASLCMRVPRMEKTSTCPAEWRWTVPLSPSPGTLK